MNLTQFREALEGLSLRVAYGGFKEPVEPPYITYIQTGRADVIGDNRHHFKVGVYDLELYFAEKDPALEAEIEGLLESLELPYIPQQDSPITDEALYQAVWEVRIPLTEPEPDESVS